MKHFGWLFLFAFLSSICHGADFTTMDLETVLSRQPQARCFVSGENRFHDDQPESLDQEQITKKLSVLKNRLEKIRQQQDALVKNGQSIASPGSEDAFWNRTRDLKVALDPLNLQIRELEQRSLRDKLPISEKLLPGIRRLVCSLSPKFSSETIVLNVLPLPDSLPDPVAGPNFLQVFFDTQATESLKIHMEQSQCLFLQLPGLRNPVLYPPPKESR